MCGKGNYDSVYYYYIVNIRYKCWYDKGVISCYLPPPGKLYIETHLIEKHCIYVVFKLFSNFINL